MGAEIPDILDMSYAKTITNQISLYAARPASCLIRVSHALGAAASFREDEKMENTENWSISKQDGMDTTPKDGFFAVWFDHKRTGATIAENIGSEEHAKLIAAAPDLLDVCQTVRKMIRGFHSLDTAKAILDTVIAKATE